MDKMIIMQEIFKMIDNTKHRLNEIENSSNAKEVKGLKYKIDTLYKEARIIEKELLANSN